MNLNPGQRVFFKTGFSSFRKEGIVVKKANEIYYIVKFNYDGTTKSIHFSWLIPVTDPNDIIKDIL